MHSVDPLRILLIGKGGQAHALAWKLSQSPRADHIFVLPGNAGTARGLEKVSNLEDISYDHFPQLIARAKELRVNLVVIGMDDAAPDGIEDCFRSEKIPCFAPSKEITEFESSRLFAKDFMQRHGIPTARYRCFRDYRLAWRYLARTEHRVIIKACGQSGYKNIVFPACKQDAHAALRQIMLKEGGSCREGHHPVIIEEYLKGAEISFLTLSDGVTIKPLPSAHNHCHVLEGSQGPYTEGMGVCAPVPMVTPEMLEHIQETILQPTIDCLRFEGRRLIGPLCTTIMLTANGPKVLEYRTRFLDPETQSIIPLLSHDTDLAEVLLASTQGKLNQVKLKFSQGFACSVEVVAGEYPDSYGQDEQVDFCPNLEGSLIFHTGTRLVDGVVSTSGHRVLTVVAVRQCLEDAIAYTYAVVKYIRLTSMYYRNDIGSRILSYIRESKESGFSDSSSSHSGIEKDRRSDGSASSSPGPSTPGRKRFHGHCRSK